MGAASSSNWGQRTLRKGMFLQTIARVLVVCLAVLAALSVLSTTPSRAYAVATAYDYEGSVFTFITEDGTELGMYREQEGSYHYYKDGKIVIEHVTSNKTIYAGFYLNADFADSSTWDDSLFIPRNSNGWLSFTLDPSYAGKAWPIAPVKVSDPTKSTSRQYYMAVPELENFEGYLLDVTFTDGQGNELSKAQVVSGSDAVPPADPKRDGFTFKGWDKPYTNITENTTINALWVEGDDDYYTVTFEDGWGNVISTQLVKEGDSAVAPDDPVHEGYVFAGWDPQELTDIMEDLTVTATWTSNDDAALAAARAAIAALPGDPKSLLRDTDNETVADAAAAYNALSDELKAKLTDDERLHLAKCAIAVLPSDPFVVTSDHKVAIDAAEAIFESLPESLQGEIDDDDKAKAISSSRSYGRYLENAVWASDALHTVNNITLLKDGTYPNEVASSVQITSTSSMGKSNSARGYGFTVKSVTVKNGRMTAIIEHGSNSSQYLRMGGVEYQNLQTDSKGHSYYEIPFALNTTFHFSVKGKDATSDTDAITYELSSTAIESTLVPGIPSSEGESSGEGSSGDDSGSGSDSDSDSGSGSDSGNTSASDSKSGSSKTSSSKSSKSGSSSSRTSSTTSTTKTSASTTSTAKRTSSSSGLSPLLRASGTNNSSSSSSGKSTASDSKTADTTAQASSSGLSTPAGSSGGARVTEVALNASDSAGGSDSVDIAPAVAGGTLLSLALGALGFVLRFVRRELA